MANPNAVSSLDNETPDEQKKREAEIKALEEAYSMPAFEGPTLAEALAGEEKTENDPNKAESLAESLSPRQEDAAKTIKGLFESDRAKGEEDESEDAEEAAEEGEAGSKPGGTEDGEDEEPETIEEDKDESSSEAEPEIEEAPDSDAEAEGEDAQAAEDQKVQLEQARASAEAVEAEKEEEEAAAENEKEEDTEPDAEDEPETDEDKQEKQKKTGASTGSPFKVAEGPRKANANTEGDQTEHLKNLDRKQIQKEFIAAADPDQGPTRLAKRFGGEQAAWTAFLAENYLKHRGKDSIQSEEDITRDTMNAQINDESEGSVRTKDAIRDLESKAHKAEYTQRIAKVQKDLELPQEKVTEQAAQDKSAEQEDTLEQEGPEDENDSTVEQQPDADAENTSEDTENSENDEQLDEEAEPDPEPEPEPDPEPEEEPSEEEEVDELVIDHTSEDEPEESPEEPADLAEQEPEEAEDAPEDPANPPATPPPGVNNPDSDNSEELPDIDPEDAEGAEEAEDAPEDAEEDPEDPELTEAAEAAPEAAVKAEDQPEEAVEPVAAALFANYLGKRHAKSEELTDTQHDARANHSRALRNEAPLRAQTLEEQQRLAALEEQPIATREESRYARGSEQSLNLNINSKNDDESVNNPVKLSEIIAAKRLEEMQPNRLGPEAVFEQQQEARDKDDSIGTSPVAPAANAFQSTPGQATDVQAQTLPPHIANSELFSSSPQAPPSSTATSVYKKSIRIGAIIGGAITILGAAVYLIF